MSTNKHGLSRDIPAGIKREVRRECGNGCVICGRLPYHYEHFQPPFEDATKHAIAGIALLCPSHHADKTSARLSVDAVRRARSRPYNAGRSAVWSHHLTEALLLLNVGSNVASGTQCGSIGKWTCRVWLEGARVCRSAVACHRNPQRSQRSRDLAVSRQRSNCGAWVMGRHTWKDRR